MEDKINENETTKMGNKQKKYWYKKSFLAFGKKIKDKTSLFEKSTK